MKKKSKKKNDKLYIILGSIVGFIILFFIIIPFIKFRDSDTIKYIAYKDHSFKYEEDIMCYNESYFYNKNMNISISYVEVKKYLFFYFTTIHYKEGNVCDYEYYLEEEYINNFINNAEIIDNSNNIDISKLIEGRRAIISNKLYLGNNYDNGVWYKLDGKYEELYVFYIDDLLVIQVGSRDDGAKFIAYERIDGPILEIQSNMIDCPTPLLKLYSDKTYLFYDTYGNENGIFTPKRGTYNYDVGLILASVGKYPELDLGPYVLTNASGVKYAIYENNLELKKLISEVGVNLNKCLDYAE